MQTNIKERSMSSVITVRELNKKCGECTACCSGHLYGEAHGHKFFKGRPCFVVTKAGCSIYEDRPDVPCKSFKCGYLTFPFFPEWMRPDQSGVLATHGIFKAGDETKPYLQISEYNKPMSALSLWWFIEKYRDGQLPNLLINIGGFHHRLGTEEFLRANL